MAAGDHFGVERDLLRRAVGWRRPMSAARSAKPSTLARSNGGTSIGAPRSCASTRPSAAASVTRLGRAAARDRDGARSAARFLGRNHFEELLLARGLRGPRRADRLSARDALGLACSWPRPHHDARARPDNLRCRPAPGSSLRRAPAPASTGSPARPARPCRAAAAPATTSASPSGEAILRASSAANGWSSISRNATRASMRRPMVSQPASAASIRPGSSSTGRAPTNPSAVVSPGVMPMP